MHHSLTPIPFYPSVEMGHVLLTTPNHLTNYIRVFHYVQPKKVKVRMGAKMVVALHLHNSVA